MIVSRTPLRISLAGGGTDFPDWYTRHGGLVLSSAIDKYIYVMVNPSFDGKYRVIYSHQEVVDTVEEIQHDLVRVALQTVGIRHGVEIATIADVPSNGTGLGSSSALAVGLLNALGCYSGWPYDKELKALAEDACHLEIDLLKRPIGKQDQYIAAYGGMKLISFYRNGDTAVSEVRCEWSTKQRLAEELLLFYTGIKRDSAAILEEQWANIASREAQLSHILHKVLPTYDAILNGFKLDRVGQLLHQNWEMKKQLASTITTPEVDRFYERARAAGATGGKLTGAGGGGFLLLHCPLQCQASVRDALSELQELPFNFQRAGSVILVDGNNRCER